MARKRQPVGSLRKSHQFLVDDVLSRSDIVQIARQLGLVLTAENSSIPKTLCPFHPDKRPSLSLFRDAGTNRRDNFYCFSCGAHGDAITLTREVKSCDFPTAFAWLAELVGVDISVAKKQINSVRGPRLGFQTAERVLADETPSEAARLKDWAVSRRLPASIVAEAGLCFPDLDKIASAVANDRELIDALLDAGLLVPLSPGGTPTGRMQPLFLTETRDFFRSRVLFPIRDEFGQLVGFAGRSLGSIEPKYLYTRGFKRRSVLYRMDAVRRRIAKTTRKRNSPGKQELAHLYVVEGLVDALRLESLGFNAVAVLGSSLTGEQTECLGRLAADLERQGRQLVAHLFLDVDDAGRRGTIQSLRQLLPYATSKQFLLVDVVFPDAQAASKAKDPDELLNWVDSEGVAERLLNSWGYSAIDAMIAESWNTPLFDLSERWSERTYAQEVLALRDVELQFPAEQWRRIIDRVRPNRFHPSHYRAVLDRSETP